MSLLEFLNLGNIQCVIAIFISIINAILLVLLAKKFFQIIQISGYKINGYRVWLKDTKAKYISRIALLSFLSFACVWVTNSLFDVYNSDALYSYFGLVFYIYFSMVFWVNVNKAPQKTPLVQTRRMSRMMTAMFLICFALTFILIWLATVYTPFLRFGIIVFTPLLLPLIVPLVHYLLIPLESLIRLRYIIKAKKKLAKRPDLIKIGITGSYGKTSVKYILNKMLGEKFNVCMTPHSFNTPMGLTKVVLKYLKPENNILIAEMGAKQVGDIDYLCKLINPHHAILTGIGNQHYETFGSVENILKTKNELVLAMPENANIVFNCDSENCCKLYKNCKQKNKFAISLTKKSCVSAENVKLSTNGIEFDLVFGEQKQSCKTSLLGEHNLLNILMSACLAIKLGVSLNQIANAVAELEPISHRLEPIENGNVTVLDDAYSSNEVGANMAIQVLKLYKNHTKICVTPGIVELGKQENQVNQTLGKTLGEVCDFVIIVNKINEQSLKTGIEKTKIKPENILFAENLEQAKQKLQTIITQTNKKYVVLFGNDLPDNYT